MELLTLATNSLPLISRNTSKRVIHSTHYKQFISIVLAYDYDDKHTYYSCLRHYICRWTLTNHLVFYGQTEGSIIL
jgi:hypothetical protein